MNEQPMELTTPAEPSQDDRIMAALAHATALVPMMGLIVPIVIWATQKDRSPYLRFQAIQATAYQIAIVVLSFAGMFCYFCSFFGTFALTMGGVALFGDKGGELPPVVGFGMLAPFIVLLIYIGSQVAMVAYGILGGVLTLTGHDFRYVWLGRRVEAYLARQSTTG
ncbi:MAG: DUF4870 domain-containing protein [Chloroflexi bacterium]|nr:DUF4870 domain-containing protein [Chloroflexota bacterium]